MKKQKATTKLMRNTSHVKQIEFGAFCLLYVADGCCKKFSLRQSFRIDVNSCSSQTRCYAPHHKAYRYRMILNHHTYTVHTTHTYIGTYILSGYNVEFLQSMFEKSREKYETAKNVYARSL